MSKILIVEDDEETNSVVKDYLEHEMHVVDQSFDGKDGLEKLGFYKYDLVILDWDVPEISGLELCHRYRAWGGVAPILFLTGKRDTTDKITGFNAGADDYLTKPFSLAELAVRVRALVRRAPVTHATILRHAHVELDPAACKVTADGQTIKLVPTEFALLEFLLRNPGHVFSADALLDRVWPSRSDATYEAITTTVKRLRRKLDQPGAASIITTVHGRGYRLSD
jgi:DNA-binding response OmpR family regulator